MCPQCTDYLSRAVMIEVRWEYSKSECHAIAQACNHVLDSL
jgi:hypothetical protein